MEEKKTSWPTIRITSFFWIAAADTLMLIPATVFWMSVILYTSLGTDYVFDVILEYLSQSSWGNILVIFMVLALPALVIALNGMEYIKTGKKAYVWALGIAGSFLILGFYAALRR